VDVARQIADLNFLLKGADFPPFQVYFISPTDSDFSQGRVDLEMSLKLTQGALKAPVRMTLSELELGAEGSRFMRLPYGVALALLKDQKGRIELQFEVSGETDAPDFSLNEILRREVGNGFFRALTRSLSRIAPGWGIDIPGLDLNDLLPQGLTTDPETPKETKPVEPQAVPSFEEGAPPKGTPESRPLVF
jgi:hypothetical protein